MLDSNLVPMLPIAVLAALPALAADTAPAPAGPCPVSSALPCTITLSGPGAPSASPQCDTEPWSKLVRFTQPGRWSDSNRDGAWETVLEIRLDPARDCGCARLEVTYGKSISDWTVHVGNSPTNDGYGGDAGTTSSTAEAQIVGRQLVVYTAAQPVRRQVDKLLDLTLDPLEGRTLQLQVCDQSFGFGLAPSGRDHNPPKGRLETLNAQLLFSPGPSEGSETGRGWIYAAFNRVIHEVAGAPSHQRVGAGVRRVAIHLTP